jgi:hypothetical protein
MKFVTTADVNLHVAPKEAADASKLIPAGTEFESDGQIITANCRSTQTGSLTFLKAKIGKDEGFILSHWTEQVADKK